MTKIDELAGGPPAPAAQDYEIDGRDGEVFSVRAKLLGFTASRRDEHDHPLAYDRDGAQVTFAEAGTRCSACRWFEVGIYEVLGEHAGRCTCGLGDSEDGHHDVLCGLKSPTARYLVVTCGRSVVPGERDKRRTTWTDSAFDVIEVLTQRPDRAREPFIPAASRRALARAAQWDDDVRDAWINRAVV